MDRQALILLVEDNEHDVEVVRRTFAKAQVWNPVRVVKSAEEAVAYLENRAPYSGSDENPEPVLILLDLTLPDTDGFELLKWIRKHSKFNSVHIVVLTGSTDLHHVRESYRLGANSFLNKPLEIENVDALVAVMQGPLQLKAQSQ